ncbi:phytase [Kribbella sp. CA-293567]|uniref:phytase n=1 Tax=Kribbella sp. CA-293567 TaxID=3002436 RepID=UPI0022DD9C90|nr:phytase [Kribbella sp. CA-293567]WBQ05721.1 phytase [Kribbella sp. CA-293567]
MRIPLVVVLTAAALTVTASPSASAQKEEVQRATPSVASSASGHRGTAGAAPASDRSAPAGATDSPSAHRGLGVVRAAGETAVNWDDAAGGDANADDPAIWVNTRRPGASLVLGTLKEGGLTVFGLNGEEVQKVRVPAGGRFNNVDVVAGVTLGGQRRDLAVVTDRGLDKLRVYSVNERGVRDITSPVAPLVFSKNSAEVEEQRTAYGVAAINVGGQAYVAVSRRSESRIALFRLVAGRAGTVSYQLVKQLDLPATFTLSNGSTWSPCEEPGDRPQFEGMVFDRTTGTLYAAQEDVGIWRIPLAGKPALLERTREFGQPAAYDEETEECAPTGPVSPDGGKRLSADAEGLTIAYRGAGKTLYASSQGDSTFATFRITPKGLEFRDAFEVVDGGATDGVQHSDGAAVTTQPLGPSFPHGLLAVHDGEDTPGDGDREGTNFKLVRLEQVP